MKNENKPVFPFVNQEGSSIEDREVHYGLTKREYFAAMAMQGMLANSSLRYGDDFQMINQKAIGCADELLKQLES